MSERGGDQHLGAYLRDRRGRLDPAPFGYPPGRRRTPGLRRARDDWRTDARYLVSAFRVDAARAGAADEVRPSVEELCALSPEFKQMWDIGDLLSAQGYIVKPPRHPVLGEIAFEHSAFAV